MCEVSLHRCEVTIDGLDADINNVGSIALALYAQLNPEYDDVQASKWQAAQVSTLSIGNFAGRIIIGSILPPFFLSCYTDTCIGLISDFMHTHLHTPRAYCLCIVSSLFIISQVLALSISNVNTLWFATVLLGFSYGSLFGTMPAIMIDWFGLGKCIPSLLSPSCLIQSKNAEQPTCRKTQDGRRLLPSLAGTFSRSC